MQSKSNGGSIRGRGGPKNIVLPGSSKPSKRPNSLRDMQNKHLEEINLDMNLYFTLAGFFEERG